jgi:Tfp pilus assembly protein PilV
MRKRPKPVPGFVLLDALIGMMVGVFALVSILPLVIATIGSSDAAEQNAIAYGATRRVIENIRMYKGGTFPIGSYSATAFGAVPQLDQLKNGAATVTIGNHTNNLRRVTVSISWRSGARGGKTSTFDTMTYVGSRGVTP